MWAFELLGSLGLFLLGMWLMTEGMKLAGGQALHRLLGEWTSTRFRGLGVGVLVTVLVQSSSAITVATIGFVNAGLITFQQSVWVIFGSNVGTTMTAWLIALFGFSLDIEAFTFPLLGVGAFLRVFSPTKRGQALGMALAGFGLLFMGINSLQATFAVFSEQFDLQILGGTGAGGILMGFGIGLFLTILTQSSSAAIAIILTAVASGMGELNVAAAAVIGANVGTTSTALIATLGATPNAKRLAMAHVAFNVITAVLALLLLPVLLQFAYIIVSPETGGNEAVLLAVFHTSFNFLGIILMWPLEPWLSGRLLQQFEKKSGDSKQQTTLDKNVAAIPDLAFRALGIELKELLTDMSKFDLPAQLNAHPQTQTERAQLNQRLSVISQFITLVAQADLSKQSGDSLVASFSVLHYLRNGYDFQGLIAAQVENRATLDQQIRNLTAEWLQKLASFSSEITSTDKEWQDVHWQELLVQYQEFKKRVLLAGIERKSKMQNVELAMLIGSLSRRYVEQLLQTVTPLEILHDSSQIKTEEEKVQEDSPVATA